jgi:hypothetical protein
MEKNKGKKTNNIVIAPTTIYSHPTNICCTKQKENNKI